MKTILVPVDFSAASLRVGMAACKLAQSIGGRMVLLHVVAPPPVTINEYYAFDAGGLAVAMAGIEKDAGRRLNSLARRFVRRCAVRTMQVTGQPIATIIEKAVATKADYIVMGSHGHGAVFDLLVGSNTYGVLRRAGCPVLVIPTGKR